MDPNCYRDYSQVTEENEATILGLSPSSSDQNFPSKLHYLLQELENDGMSHIVSWQPHGRCFMVHQQEEFVETVLLRWFCQSKLTSFQRQLNIYGFRRIKAGPDKGAYYHEFFLRGKLFLASRIPRMKLKGIGSRRPNAEMCEPNFYAMKWLPETTPAVVTPPPQITNHPTMGGFEDSSALSLPVISAPADLGCYGHHGDATPTLSSLCLGAAHAEMTLRSSDNNAIPYLSGDANMGNRSLENGIASVGLARVMVLQSLAARQRLAAANAAVHSRFSTMELVQTYLDRHRNQRSGQTTYEQVRDALREELIRRSNNNQQQH